MGEDNPIRNPLAIKRGSKRARLNATGKLLTATGEMEVRLRDLSSAGALGETTRPPAEGSEVVLACGSAVVPAGVSWVVGHRFGLEFRQPLSDEVVAMLASRARRMG